MKTTILQEIFVAAFLILLIGATSAMTQAATTLVVDDDLNCAGAVYSTIGAALTAAAPGDTVQLCAGTYEESNLHLTKDNLTIVGAGATSTVMNAGGNIGFFVEASALTIKDLTIQNSYKGLRFFKYLSTISNTEVNGVTFLNYAIYGIELSESTFVNDLSVTDCSFVNNQPSSYRIAMVFSANSAVDGLTVSGSTFTGNTLGIAQFHRSWSAWTYRNFRVANSTFMDNSSAAIYVEDIRGSVIENNQFTNNQSGFYIYNHTNSVIENVVVRNNEFTHTTGPSLAVLLRNHTSNGVDGVTVSCNSITGHGVGVSMSGAGYGWNTVQIKNNNIYDNVIGAQAADNLSGTVVDMTDNWWNKQTGPTHYTNPGGTGDLISDPYGAINFMPFRTARIPDLDNDGIQDTCDSSVGPPTLAEQCMNGGWMYFNQPRTFKNQGDCLQYFFTGL